MIRRPPHVRPTIAQIATSAAYWHNIFYGDIVGKSRRAEYVTARDDVIFVARYYGHTLEAIAEALERHHTTILHSVQKTGAKIGKNYDR